MTPREKVESITRLQFSKMSKSGKVDNVEYVPLNSVLAIVDEEVRRLTEALEREQAAVREWVPQREEKIDRLQSREAEARWLVENAGDRWFINEDSTEEWRERRDAWLSGAAPAQTIPDGMRNCPECEGRGYVEDWDALRGGEVKK